MKKNNVLALVLTLVCISPLSFAEQTEVTCEEEIFTKNNCQACYTEDFAAYESENGWKSEIKDLTIPWSHSGGEMDEMLYDDEQRNPELRTTLKYSMNPEKIDELWVNHNDIVWQPFEDNKEFILKKDEKVGIYTLRSTAAITVNGDNLEDNIFFFTNLRVRDFAQETNNISAPRDRNICIKGTFNLEKKPMITPIETGTTAEPNTVLQIPTTEALPELTTGINELDNPEPTTAGEENSETNITPLILNSAEKQPAITSDQTNTQTGPLAWIMFTLACAGATYIRSRKKLS